MPGSKAPRYAVDVMEEGEILVRGTLDPHEALKVVFSEDWDDLPTDLDDLLYQAAHPRYPEDGYKITDEAVNKLAEALFEMLERARCQYWRKIPCLPSSYGFYEGWAYELRPAEKGKPGAFPGVEFPRP